MDTGCCLRRGQRPKTIYGWVGCGGEGVWNACGVCACVRAAEWQHCRGPFPPHHDVTSGWGRLRYESTAQIHVCSRTNRSSSSQSQRNWLLGWMWCSALQRTF
ncbi:hypothetical protein LSTR_LSTR001870 [Laodelphax striatellus]|uniref:Uncharacterized protein n=1 Tax=Laodelphax striatellus TaxID=195883 RepID=A0A482WGR0_LAOST|nr:hypothetical protein LSTR_LSTR001870 [Laodelphax striatellus]